MQFRKNLSSREIAITCGVKCPVCDQQVNESIALGKSDKSRKKDRLHVRIGNSKSLKL